MSAASELISAPRNRRLFLALLIIGLQRTLQVAASLALIPGILQALGKTDFGIWGAATSLAWLGAMLDLGLGGALITLVLQGISGKNIASLSGYVTAGILGATGMAVLVLLLGSCAVSFTTTGGERTVFLIAIAGLAINIPFSLAANVWIGLQKSHIAAGWDIVQTVFLITGMLWAIHTGAGAPFMVAVFYFSTVFASMLSFLHLMLVHPELRPRRLAPTPDIWRQIIINGSLFTFISVASCLTYALDNIITLAALGPIPSAKMAIILRIGINATGLINILTQPLWPAFSDAHSKGDERWIRRTLLLGTAGITLLCALGSAIMILFGHDLLRWWLHDDLGIGTGLLTITALWIFSLSVSRIAALLLCALTLYKFQLKVIVIASAVALTSKLLIAPHFGTAGILLATAASWLLILTPAFFFKVRRCL